MDHSTFLRGIVWSCLDNDHKESQTENRVVFKSSQGVCVHDETVTRRIEHVAGILLVNQTHEFLRYSHETNMHYE